MIDDMPAPKNSNPDYKSARKMMVDLYDMYNEFEQDFKTFNSYYKDYINGHTSEAEWEYKKMCLMDFIEWLEGKCVSFINRHE